MNKLHFLQNEFPKLASTLKPDAQGAWGVLNGQQMVEHMTEAVSQATGNNNQKLHSAVEHVGKYKDFAMSDKEFKPNTKNALMSDIPTPAKKNNMQEAIAAYEKQVLDFISYFDKNKGATITNPFFGDLNYEEWLHLLHKHAVHHAKQFGLM